MFGTFVYAFHNRISDVFPDVSRDPLKCLHQNQDEASNGDNFISVDPDLFMKENFVYAIHNRILDVYQNVYGVHILCQIFINVFHK